MAAPPAPTRTLLVLNNMGIPLYSARGLTQTLKPITEAVQLFRSINGAMMDFSLAAFQKYSTTITCTDRRAPRMDGVWPGRVVTMHSVAELSYLTSGGSPIRGVVPGSSYVEGDYTFYRPILNVMLMNIEQQAQEYPGDVAWSAEFEEA